MSSVTSPLPTPARPGAPAGTRLPSALAARRWTVVLAPVLAGILATVGSLADPAAGKDGRELIAAYADEPERVQIKALGYHFAYALWVPMVFGLVALVRGRGGWLGNTAAVLGFLGVTTMPGFILVDFMDSAAGQTVGIDAATRIGETAEGMWALAVMGASGALGFILSLPLAATAAWRAGLLPWWAPVAVVVGLLSFAVSSATWPGTAGMTVAFAAFAVALARIDRGEWGHPLRRASH